MRRLILVLSGLVIVGAAAWFGFRNPTEAAQSYRTVTVEVGSVRRTISATGTLEPKTTVEVGTQVSGQIAEILVDFNDPVEAGQVIARIDPQNLATAVTQSEISLRKAKADLADKQREATRIEGLYSRDLAAEVDRTTAAYGLEIAQANYEAAQIDLDRAEQNLQYATIRAPVSGVVIERSVDVGQTVAASLSAPQLFVLAADLGEMQILATVDESDVGEVKQGQLVEFTVQAYPTETFAGQVRQIRLQPSLQDNVVSYTVVIAVDNSREVLLPGMTATVDFVVEEAQDALTVANAALRYRPSESLLAEAMENSRDASSGQSSRQNAPREIDRESREAGSPYRSMVIYLGADGQPRVAPIRTGISDGSVTTVESPVLEEGMTVVTGQSSGGASDASSSSSSTTRNPFESNDNSNRRRGPGRPGGF